MLDLIQVHPNDALARASIVRILNFHHNKRIGQNKLNFYRHDFQNFIKTKTIGGEVIFLIALHQAMPVGISCCAVYRKTGNVNNSLTVVVRDFRKSGIGKSLLAAKIAIHRLTYPQGRFLTFVSKENSPGIKICEANKLLMSEEHEPIIKFYNDPTKSIF